MCTTSCSYSHNLFGGDLTLLPFTPLWVHLHTHIKSYLCRFLLVNFLAKYTDEANKLPDKGINYTVASSL